MDEIAASEDIGNTVTHLVYCGTITPTTPARRTCSATMSYGGHAEPADLLLRDNDATRPAPDVTFEDRYTLRVGGERVELALPRARPARPDDIYIHFPTTTR